MSVDIRSSDRRKYMNEIQAREKEIAAGLLKVSQSESPKLQETDKRHRREIANSNERRRMQCINAGFSSLRALIPQLEGEKLSKAAILQHTTEYIGAIEKEKRQLQLQVEHSMRLLADRGQTQTQGQQQENRAAGTNGGSDGFTNCAPPPSKRKKRITESSDEGVGAMSDESDEGGQASERLRQENINLRHELEAERRRCQALENRSRVLEGQLISLLQQAQQAVVHGGVEQDLAPVKLEPTQSSAAHDSMYNREVVEVIGSLQGMPTPPREDTTSQHYVQLQPPRPLSPTPERGMAFEVPASNPPQILGESHSHHDSSASPLLRASLSPAVKPEVVTTYHELSAPGVAFQRVSALPEVSVVPEKMNAESAPTITTTPISAPSSQPGDDQPVRGYRDHPRRRHRQQAALERQRAQQQQEEEERQRREQEEQERLMSAPNQVFRPYQNLENLVEAIRHIEGEAALCDPGRMYEEEQKLYEKRQHISSEECSSMSDPDELKSEGSGRDSPLQHHRLQPAYHQQHPHVHQQNTTLPEHCLQLNSPPSMSSSSLSSRSLPSMPSEVEPSAPQAATVVSDYHPATASLLHHPSQFYRPHTILHKQ